MKLTKVISTAIDKGKQIVKILGFGSADVQTVFTIQPFGIDGNPVKGYRAIYADTASKEDKVLIGVIFENALADVGELRLHSEDADGAEMASIHLKNNGDIKMAANAAATLNALADGNLELNGNADFIARFSELKNGFDQLKSDFNTFINTQYNVHVHTGVTTGAGSSAVTPQLGSPSSASIDGSKVDNVKTN